MAIGRMQNSSKDKILTSSPISLLHQVISILNCKIELVDSNKSSLILKIVFQNTRTLLLFTEIIETESIYKSN
jgi:hypothetical protein